MSLVPATREVRRIVGKAAIDRIFGSLGIPFKKVRRRTFLEANEADLEYLYYDFVVKSKAVLAELHPDHGGDHDRFILFNQQREGVLRIFAKRGFGAESVLVKALRAESESASSNGDRKLLPPKVRTPRPSRTPEEKKAERAKSYLVWRNQNLEKIREYRRNRRASYAENLEERGKILQSNREYYCRHRERICAERRATVQRKKEAKRQELKPQI